MNTYSKSDDFEEVRSDASSYPQTLPIRFDLAAAPVPAFRARAYTADIIQAEGAPDFAAFSVAAPGDAFALYVPLDAPELRTLAAGLLRCAARLDGGSGLQ